MIRKIIKIFASAMVAVLVIFVLAIVGAHFYLKTDHAQNRIKSTVNNAIPGQITWERAEISILGGNIGLHGAHVSGPAGDTIVDARFIFVDIGIVDLLRGSIVITAQLDAPQVMLSRDHEGDFNIVRAFADPSPEEEPEPEIEEIPIERPFPFTIVLKSVTLSDGFFEFQDHAAPSGEKPGHIALEDINVEIDDANMADRSGRGAVRIGEGIVDMAGIRIPLVKFHVESMIDNGRVEPTLADIQLAGENGGPRLSLAGSASNVFEDPLVDFEMEAFAELSDIKEMLSLNMPLSGKATLSLDASGRPANPSVQLKAHYDGGRLVVMDLEEIDLDAAMTDLSVDFKRLAARIEGAALDVTGSVDLADAFENGLTAAPTDLDAISYDLALDGKNIDFDQLTWTRPYMSGIANATIEIDGTGIFPRTLSARIDSKIKGEAIAAGSILAPIDPEISVSGRIKEGKAIADPIEVAIQDTRLRATGDYVIFEGIVDAALDLDTPDMAQFLAPLRVDASSGRATLSGTISGPVMQPDINADLVADNLAYNDIRFGDVVLDAALDTSGRVRVERLFTDNRGSQVEINGHLDLFDGGFTGFQSDMPAKLTAQFNNVEIPDFYPHIDLSGRFSGRLDLWEKITAPAATLCLSASGLAHGEMDIGAIETDMQLADGTLAVDKLRLENRQSTVRLAGTAALFEPGSLSLLPTPVLDLMFPESVIYIDDFLDTAGGRIALEGFAKGALDDLTADLSVAGTDLEAAGHAIGELTAKAGFADGRISVDPLKIENKRSLVTVSGGIDLFEPATLTLHEDPAIEMEIAGDAIYIDDFIAAMGGRLSISGNVDGSVGDPKGNIRISGEDIDLGVQRLESIRVESIFEDKTVFFDAAHIALAPDETLRASGRFSLDRRFAFDIDSDEIGIQHIGMLEDTGITGTMTLAASGDGTLDDPVISGNLALFDIMGEHNNVAPIDVAFDVKDRIANARATSDFIIDANYHLDSGDFDLDGTFDDTRLDPYLHAAGLTHLTGHVTAEVNAAGNAEKISRTTATLDIFQMTLSQRTNNLEPRELIRVSGLTADFEDGVYTIPENEIALLETNRLTLYGSGRIDGDFEFMAEGALPLAVASAFVPYLEDPTGEIRFSGRLFQANGAQPDLDAEIQLLDIGLMVPELMQSLHGVNGVIRITGERIALDNLEGRLDTGRFTAEGTVELGENLSPGQAELSVNAHNLPIQVPGTMQTTINSTMTFSGTPDDSRLSGTVVLLDGLYYRDFEISLIGEVTRRRRAAPEAAERPDYEIPYLRNLALDIDTSYRRPVMVDNNLALMTLRPEIHINGTLNQPRVTGRAEVSQGTVSYQNVEFDIDRGVIDFIDPYRIQPEIDIRAVSHVRRWTINLEISGTPDDLAFHLTSNPPEEHADILSLLLLGQTTREMTEGTGPAGPSPEEMLVNLLAGRLEEDLRAGTGLDIIEFEYTRSEPGETEPGVRVTVGKELSRRLLVTYGLERRSGETVHQQTAIYRLLEFMSLSAFQDTAGTYGGEMQFRLEYR